LVVDRDKLIHRGVALAVACTLIAGTIVLAANADSSMERARKQRKLVVHKITQLHELRHDGRIRHNQKIKTLTTRIQKVRKGSAEVSLEAGRTRSDGRSHYLRNQRLKARQQLKGFLRFVERRTERLRFQRQQLSDWIETYGIFQHCPVRGPVTYNDGFGYWIPKRPGVPAHTHMGIDMMAATGTPIVATFNGVAVASPNRLGGLAVKVYGALGYTYNAHLSAYGKLGKVRSGDVVGYVGSTGDAGGPHDHFEWHPGNGSAVDPYVYLNAVC
jgi:murein DD-endopeptidase MepM/ murein hydrolase activator NlpD